MIGIQCVTEKTNSDDTDKRNNNIPTVKYAETNNHMDIYYIGNNCNSAELQQQSLYSYNQDGDNLIRY
ncbi:MAG: hypothetical protein QS748_12545 [Candidatus Endonucleobacter bathymodioli]|uniref:Uncharacterized protein n=1 Tax=Candidatus Endonucleibacter bathymodioli TaxID=539814 RepID=A0AA90NVA5_9GAMM|nr:hypothetical protein [Candidatus Endonucleobacter bathymodioli]